MPPGRYTGPYTVRRNSLLQLSDYQCSMTSPHFDSTGIVQIGKRQERTYDELPWNSFTEQKEFIPTGYEYSTWHEDEYFLSEGGIPDKLLDSFYRRPDVVQETQDLFNAARADRTLDLVSRDVQAIPEAPDTDLSQ